jgi:hypothetical protein
LKHNCDLNFRASKPRLGLLVKYWSNTGQILVKYLDRGEASLVVELQSYPTVCTGQPKPAGKCSVGFPRGPGARWFKWLARGGASDCPGNLNDDQQTQWPPLPSSPLSLRLRDPGPSALRAQPVGRAGSGGIRPRGCLHRGFGFMMLTAKIPCSQLHDAHRDSKKSCTQLHDANSEKSTGTTSRSSQQKFLVHNFMMFTAKNSCTQP